MHLSLVIGHWSFVIHWSGDLRFEEMYAEGIADPPEHHSK
jgi:hypothetical protein